MKNAYDFGVVGNCSFMAYVDTSADVKWMCMPRFDSSFIFGSLLDEEKGGHFSIRPCGENSRGVQSYLPNTNVLSTEFICDGGGRFRIIDFAPRFTNTGRRFKPNMLFRKIEVLSGAPMVRVECTPRYEYGEKASNVSMGSNHLRFDGFDNEVRLTTNIPLSYILDKKEFVLTETKYICFSYGLPLEGPLEETTETFLYKTIQYWQRWVKGMSISTMYQKQVIRSALVLKLHQYEDTGGVIASGTTSLPEAHLSTRNWDYRYCWMRDTYYTLAALNNIGHFEESERYFHFIVNIIQSEKDRIQPLYSITGEKKLTEISIPLEGYKGNKPVRIGNDAYTHIQNDVYGQVLASLMPLYVDDRLIHTARLDYDTIRKLLNMIEKTMDEKDAGLWEFRNISQHHTYTYLFNWVGARAAAKMAKITQDQDMLEQAERLTLISATYIERAYDEEQKCYTQAIGTPHLDASCLHLITMHYLDPNSKKARLHLEAIEKKLLSKDGLMYRYIHADDFGTPETTFLVCSFWYVETLACVGRVEDALRVLDRLVSHSNHLHIFSEDVGLDGNQWGNFPQTYSHVGLMNAVYRIAAKLNRPSFL